MVVPGGRQTAFPGPNMTFSGLQKPHSPAAPGRLPSALKGGRGSSKGDGGNLPSALNTPLYPSSPPPLHPFWTFFDFLEVQKVAYIERIKCRLTHQNRLVISRDNTESEASPGPQTVV